MGAWNPVPILRTIASTGHRIGYSVGVWGSAFCSSQEVTGLPGLGSEAVPGARVLDSLFCLLPPTMRFRSRCSVTRELHGFQGAAPAQGWA